jgi:hypothetical protein
MVDIHDPVLYIPNVVGAGFLGICTYYIRTIRAAFTDSNDRYKETALEAHAELVEAKITFKAEHEAMNVKLTALDAKINLMSEALDRCRRESAQHEAEAIVMKAKVEQLTIAVKGISGNGQADAGTISTTG